MVNNNNLSTLNKEEALEKFIEGKDIWNEYIDKHPDANIDFSYVDFSGRREEGEPFDFSGYKFPKKGNVDFSDANFGKGDVNFWEAEFGKGDVNFNRAIFGEKEECSDCSSVGFTGATFGEGNISFLNTQLGQNATVFFDLATFGKGRVSFKDSEVVNGDISFRAVVFGEGKVG
ncbi:hypothetical protein BMR08_16505 [Methylococcaceae bacterium CS2]|nr:hypothetical protein BMR08_16505 [Methylococcaceae bacterium CS2]